MRNTGCLRLPQAGLVLGNSSCLGRLHCSALCLVPCASLCEAMRTTCRLWCTAHSKAHCQLRIWSRYKHQELHDHHLNMIVQSSAIQMVGIFLAGSPFLVARMSFVLCPSFGRECAGDWASEGACFIQPPRTLDSRLVFQRLHGQEGEVREISGRSCSGDSFGKENSLDTLASWRLILV